MTNPFRRVLAPAALAAAFALTPSQAPAQDADDAPPSDGKAPHERTLNVRGREDIFVAEQGATDADQPEQKRMLSLTRAAPFLTPVWNYSGDLHERATLTGDWWGARQDLYESGFTFDAALTQVFQGIAAGGKETGNDYTYTGLLDYGGTLDTGKLNWWPGGLFVVNAQTGFAAHSPLGSGNISPPNYLTILPEPEKPSTFLMEYYYVQGFSEKVSVIIGRVNAANFLDENRFANDPRTQFLNIAFGNDPLVGSVISFSTYGVLGSIKITDNFTISPAIYDATTGPGNYFNDLFQDVGLATQLELDWKLGDGLNGAFRPAFIWVSKDVTALDNSRLLLEVVEGIDVDTKSGNWLLSMNVEQYLWKPDASAGGKNTVPTTLYAFQERGIGIFGRFGFSPEDRNAYNFFASGGIGARGIMPGRPNDRTGIGVYYMKKSDDLDDQPGDLLRDEYGVEAYYNLAVTPSIQLSLDVQWIRPGVVETRNTIVVGFRLYTPF